jgi:hypothetical protein
MKKYLIPFLIFIFVLHLSGCGNTGISQTTSDHTALLHTIDQLSKINSYELTETRVESTAFGDKQLRTQKTTEMKLIFEPFASWSSSSSTSLQIDGSQYKALNEAYQALEDDNLNIYMRYGHRENSEIDQEIDLGEWEKVSSVPKEQSNWFFDMMRSNFDAQIYLLDSNIDTFEFVENDQVKDENMLQYDGYLEQQTILEAYQKYIRNVYVNGNMLPKSNDMSLEDLKTEITDGELYEIKVGIPKLAYSEKPVPVSLWIDKSTFALKKVIIDETLVMQSYMEKEMPKTNPNLGPPIVSKALLTFEIKSIDKLKEIPMPD